MWTPKRWRIYFIIQFIGFWSLHVNASSLSSGLKTDSARERKASEEIDVSELSGSPNGQGGWVIVEPINIWSATTTESATIVPYKYRRKPWGQTFSVAYSQYNPENLGSNLGTVEFSDFYDANADTPLIELQVAFKRNYSLGSLGFEIGAGYYSNDSDTDLVDSNIEIIPIRLGLQYNMDTIFETPYVAPYVSFGGYILRHTESQGTTSFNGTTQVAPYMTAGLQFSLDWIDKHSASIAYFEGGIETTSLFVEARKFYASTAETDPNFETPFQLQAGLRLEF